jgi:hypothetical protein
MAREIVIHGKLLAMSKDVGNYTTYVFQNLDAKEDDNLYMMCTRLPNWQHPPLNIGDQGYVSMKEIIAGLDKWYDRETEQFYNYGFSQIYFIKFVADNSSNEVTIVVD